MQLDEARQLSAGGTRTQMVAVVEGNGSAKSPAESATEVRRQKKTRQASKQASDEKPRSLESLPDWARLKWPVYVGTLIELAGQYQEPDGGWEIEKNKDTFIGLLQTALTAVYSNIIYAITSTSAIYYIVSVRKALFRDDHSRRISSAQGRQVITDWRRRFSTKAGEILRKDMQKRGDKHVRAAYAKAAMQKTGLAYWKEIDIRKVCLYLFSRELHSRTHL